METMSQSAAVELVFAGNVTRQSGYCEIPTSLLVSRFDVKMPDLPDPEFYFQKEGQFQQLRPAKQPISYLALSLHSSIWVKDADFPQMQTFAEKMLRKISTDPSLPAEKRVEVLQKSAMKVVEGLFETPSKENIDRSVKVVGSFVYLLMKDPKAYLLLSKLSDHDPYTLRHSVGVSVHAIILAKKLGISDENELNEVGIAGLLHDIGKTKVKREIINKEGPLNDIEWEEMRSHPREGYDIIKNHPNLSERTKLAVLEHHEDRDGTGYPQKVPLSTTDLFSRIVAISDIFNALTTDRSYSKAKLPFEAFQLMKDKLSKKFDEDLFQKLVKIYGGELS